MSKTPYTIDVDRYICAELESIRKMSETRDFSSLASTVERIQFHATAMEDALYSQKSKLMDIQKIVENKKDSETKKLKSMSKITKKLKW